MRSLRLLVCAAVFASAVGCDFMRKQIRPADGGVVGTGELPAVGPDLLVGYLNQRAGQMQSLYYDDVWMRCYDGKMPLPALTGVMDCAQPRNFRMRSNGRLAGEIDMGSNADQFWVYVKAGGDPVYVFASHTDFEQGKARLPGNIPFEPAWVMQVLGMMKYPESNSYNVATGRADRTYTLSWQDRTPQGPVVKEVVFEADENIGTRPRVKKHVVREAGGNKTVIAFAEVKKTGTQVLPATDPKAGYGLPVQYPTDVTLRWEEQKFEMHLELKGVRINEPMTADREKRFQRPNIRGANPIDLTRYEEFRPTGRRG
jgi:hypothetical protein